LTEEERKAAWEEFENEKKGLNSLVGNPAVNNFANFNFNPEDIAVKLKFALKKTLLTELWQFVSYINLLPAVTV
jgi:hypothetical protein